MSRCSICRNAQVNEVDVLLATGSSIRKVARLYSLPRTTLARHAEHAKVSGSRFGMIRGEGGPDGPPGPLDPLAAALELAGRARTPRERLRSAEAVRSATALAVRAMRELDAEMLERLDANVLRAADLYHEVGGSFENELRALSGHREAIRHRLEAVRPADAIEVPMVVASADGPLGQPNTVTMASAEYWRGVPDRYRDPERFVVERVIALALQGPGTEEIKVYEGERDVLAWSTEHKR